MPNTAESLPKYNCEYIDSQGRQCGGDAQSNGLCGWHDPDVPKESEQDRIELENWARANRPMEGFKLAHARLDHVNLVNRGKKAGYNLRYADLYHAHLRDAHLFHIDLRGSSLVKADLSGANLNCADLRDCNLLGANFDQSKLEHVEWGEFICQEVEALKALRNGRKSHAMDLLSQAEEIYRNLRRCSEDRGHFDHAGFFFYKEMIMRRLQMPVYSMERFLSKMVDVFCGYGEKPDRVIISALALIFLCTVGFYFLGIHYGDQVVAFSPTATYQENLLSLGYCAYYSVVTFTTLGYGDMTPFGWSRLLASFEAFTGAFSISLFVVVFVKKMTR